MKKNKSKVSLVIAILALTASMGGVANAADVDFDAQSTVDIGGNSYVIDSGSEATSVVVGSSNLTATVAAGDTLIFGSLDRFSLGNDLGIDESCGQNSSFLTVTGPATIVITPDPSTVACGGGGGGGGGGGSSNNDDEDEEDEDAPAAPTTPTVPAAPSKPLSEMTIPELQAEVTRIMALIQQLRAQLLATQGGGPAAPAVCVASFNADLYSGISGSEEVRRLQEFLIGRGHLAAGLNTGNFFGLTQNAVKAYQAVKGITPVSGYFGPLTRAAVNADCGL